MKKVKSPMSGNVWKVLVSAGDEVHADQEVAILESMKMEIPIESEQNGKVVEIKYNEGEFVNEGDVLMIIE
ncbi:acetyl-CoA carboxylase biotin carboxyl carrier protein subunit [Peribacillus butanolivorans]|uniref:acetyl-CoA carboxylase biotin carboxyl carrier protein subunit n=1 Tax=Peribacillus butanolivorans TaxID=421767 RepID=UPI00365DAE05